jgi:hypothetical protein
MTTTTVQTSTAVAVLVGNADDRVKKASLRLFEAEVALHEARQTRVDRWITAASDRLHAAVIDYRFALATHGY